MLRHQLAILLENFEEAYSAIVKFANQHCMCEFTPESHSYNDIPGPILRILSSQKTDNFAQTMVTPVSMGVFVEAVIKRNYSLMPTGVKQLSPARMQELAALCQSMAEITAIFGSVNRISHNYRDKEGYVLKRLYQLSQDENEFSEDGFNAQVSRLNCPSYAGKPWQLGEYPTDPELVSSVFCALLDYSVKNRRTHLYDTSLPVSEITKFSS